MSETMRKFTILLLAVAAAGCSTFSTDREFGGAVEVWKGAIPFAKDNLPKELMKNGCVRNVSVPQLLIFPAKENNSGNAVVICPGGGYGLLSMENEGIKVAEWLNEFGVSAFVLKYRHKQFKHPVPLMDAQQAVKVVRHNAELWGIDKEKIGIMGFSAGGHLASTVLTHASRPVNKVGELSAVSCHVNFAILGYPVINLQDDRFCHKGSRNNLLGTEQSEDVTRQLTASAAESQVNVPTFIFHSKADRVVPVENSQQLYKKLQKEGIKSELFLIDDNRHGYGIKNKIWLKPVKEFIQSL